MGAFQGSTAGAEGERQRGTWTLGFDPRDLDRACKCMQSSELSIDIKNYLDGFNEKLAGVFIQSFT